MSDHSTPPTRPEDVKDEHRVGEPSVVDAYMAMTDTVAGLSLRPMDNVVQLVSVFIGIAMGVLIGGLLGGGAGAMLGAVAGAFVALIISGTVLGLIRLVKRLRR